MKLKLKESKGERIPLQAVIDVNMAMNSILKESYRNLAGKKSRSPSELKIYVGRVEQGSIIEDILIEVLKDPKFIGQLAFEAFNIGPNHVFEVTKEAFKFLLDYSKRKKEGREVHIHLSDSPNAIVNVGDGNSITVSYPVFNTATAITKHGQKLTKAVKNEELEFIEFGNATDRIRFDKENYDCFESVVDVDDDVKVIVGNIVSFNKESRSGTVKFFENMEEKSLKFSLSGKKFLIDTIESMKDQQCRLHCHELYVLGPNKKKSVVALEVFKISKVLREKTIVIRNNTNVDN